MGEIYFSELNLSSFLLHVTCCRLLVYEPVYFKPVSQRTQWIFPQSSAVPVRGGFCHFHMKPVKSNTNVQHLTHRCCCYERDDPSDALAPPTAQVVRLTSNVNTLTRLSFVSRLLMNVQEAAALASEKKFAKWTSLLMDGKMCGLIFLIWRRTFC